MATDAEKLAIRCVMRNIPSPCIVELGARTGEDEEWLRAACGEDPHYIMVEPDMWNAQKILDHPRGLDQNRKLILGAVSDENGSITFWTSLNNKDDSRTSGSIRRPLYSHTCKYPDVRFRDEPIVVPSWTLDSIFAKDWLTKIDLLWVDIQGAEGDMIIGGRRALERTRYLFMEVEDVELYRGQALRSDLLGMLQGWRLIQDFGDNVLLLNPNMIEGRL